MRAAVIEAGSFVVGDVPDPAPGPADLVLRVAACGICGSDVKTAKYMPDGTVMGHEFAGEVVAAGRDVAARWPLGTVVAAMPVIGCGGCRDCALGDIARCAAVEALGVGGGPGAFAEYVRVGAHETVRLDGLPARDGALVEPLAVGLHAFDRARVAPGDRVLILGAGPVGLAVLTWARRLGTAEITVSDPQPDRRASAELFGATEVVDPAAQPLGGPYDVVIECAGVPGMVASCIDAAAPRGRIVIAGVCIDPDPFSPVAGVVKEVEMHFVSYYTRREFRHTARLLADGRLDPGPLVTGRVGLTGVAAAVTDLARPGAQRKVLVVPELEEAP